MRSLPLSVRLTAAAALTALAVIGLFAAVNLRSHRESLIAEVERHADQLSGAVIASTEYDMMLNQRDRLQLGIERMGSRPGVSGIRLLNKGGTVIYSSDRRDIGGTVHKDAESCAMCHSGSAPLTKLEPSKRTRVWSPGGGPRMLGIITPVYNQDSCSTAACHVHSRSQLVLGVLDVTLPLEEADRDVRRAAVQLALLALTSAAALAACLGLLVSRWVGEPVAELVAATRRVAGGELQVELAPRGDDELGTLARSFNDMTRRLSEARLQLFQSDKLASLGRLAAGVAHEINNPLTGVLTYASYLAKRTSDRPEVQRDLEVIVRETVRSREIVKSLLDFARQSVPKKEPADLNAVVRRAASVVDNQARLAKAELSFSFDPALPPAVVDPNQMQQVFINLLVNAMDSLGAAGGAVSVSTGVEAGPQGRRIRVAVKDTGCGIPPEARRRIFEPFYSTKGQKGTGLGLSVIWGIVENHGGTITVDSEPGKGSTFTVWVPAEP